jgi:hypothetical protein
MASLIKYPSGRYWIAAFRDSSGRQHRRTTRETDRKRALAVAEQYERAAKSNGNPQRVRQILSEFLRDHYDQELPFSSVSDFTKQWLAARKSETSPGTHRRYGDAIAKFLTFLAQPRIVVLIKSPRRRSRRFVMLSWPIALQRQPTTA